MTKAIVALSGGMDSATVLGMVCGLYYPSDSGGIRAVGFTYGSKHNKYENAAAYALAEFYRVPFTLIDLTTVTKHLQSDLLLSGGDVPEGHYEAKSMKRTVVPGRNIIFASILAGIAMSEGAGAVFLGVHAGDHAIYPDCRPEFIQWMGHAINAGTDGKVSLVTPFLHGYKADILRAGLARIPPVPYQLTRTCYKDQPIACGKCGSCQERIEAFVKNGVTDPIPYEPH